MFIYKMHFHANKCDFSKALNIRIFSFSLDAMTERKVIISRKSLRTLAHAIYRDSLGCKN